MDELFFNVDDLNLEETNTEETTEETKTEEVQGEAAQDEAVDTPPIVDEGQTTEEEEEEQESSPLYEMVKYLQDQGVLYLEEDVKQDQIKSLEDMKKILQESNSKTKYANLSESQIRYHDALEAGIPKGEFEDIEREIITLQNVKPEEVEADENARFQIFALDFIEKGIERENAIKLARLQVQEKDAVESAKKTLETLVETKKQKFKSLVEAKQEENKLTVEKIKDTIYSKEKLLEMDLNDITKNKLFDQMTTKVGTDENGNPMNQFDKWQKENPLESTILLNYFYMITDGGKDLGLIKKTSDSKATKELEKKLKAISFDKDGAALIQDRTFQKQNQVGNSGITLNI